MTFMFPPAFVMLVDRPDGSQYIWIRCNLSTLAEHGTLGFTHPKKLPKLVQPKDLRWQLANSIMRWSGYEEGELQLMRKIGRLTLRTFRTAKPHLTMTDLLTSVMNGAVPHLQLPAEQGPAAAAAPSSSARATAPPSSSAAAPSFTLAVSADSAGQTRHETLQSSMGQTPQDTIQAAGQTRPETLDETETNMVEMVQPEMEQPEMSGTSPGSVHHPSLDDELFGL